MKKILVGLIIAGFFVISNTETAIGMTFNVETIYFENGHSQLYINGSSLFSYLTNSRHPVGIGFGENRSLLVWEEEEVIGQIYLYYSYYLNGSWSVPEKVETNFESNGASWLAVVSGTPTLVFSANSGSGEDSIYKMIWEDDSWTKLKEVTDNPLIPHITPRIDESGSIYWKEFNEEEGVYYWVKQNPDGIVIHLNEDQAPDKKDRELSEVFVGPYSKTTWNQGKTSVQRGITHPFVQDDEGMRRLLNDNLVVVAHGNSITHRYKYWLEDMLADLYNVVKLGVSGSTTVDGLKLAAEALRKYSPHLMTCGWGYNDLYYAISFQTTKFNWRKLIGMSDKIIMVGMSGGRNPREDSIVKEYNKTLREIVGKRFVEVRSCAGDSWEDWMKCAPDGIHPEDPECQKCYARKISAKIKELDPLNRSRPQAGSTRLEPTSASRQTVTGSGGGGCFVETVKIWE